MLFLCTGNSARRQIAEGLIRQKARDWLEAHSAGAPPKEINSLAIRVMNEAGIDISGQTSKDVGGMIKQSFDWVFTVCDRAKEKCPIFPGARVSNWDITDPESRDDFRRIREKLSHRIDDFLQQIQPPLN